MRETGHFTRFVFPNKLSFSSEICFLYVLSYPHVCAFSANLNTLLRQAVDLKDKGLAVLDGLARVERDWHADRFTGVNHTSTKSVMQLGGRRVQTINAAMHKVNIQIFSNQHKAKQFLPFLKWHRTTIYPSNLRQGLPQKYMSIIIWSL